MEASDAQFIVGSVPGCGTTEEETLKCCAAEQPGGSAVVGVWIGVRIGAWDGAEDTGEMAAQQLNEIALDVDETI